MTRWPRITTALGALAVLSLVPLCRLRAQGPATAAPSAGPRIVVLEFEFAAPTLAEPRSRPPHPPRPPITGPRLGREPGVVPVFAGARLDAGRTGPPAPYPGGTSRDDDLAAGIGEGVADLLVERLLHAGGFRVLERRRLDAVVAERAIDSSARSAGGAPAALHGRPPSGGADYLVTGSVVRFGTEEHHALGGFGRIIGLGALGLVRHTTTVTLVARVVDAASGEVVLVARGEGVSRKGTGLTLGGIARGAGGVVSVGSSSFRESALGEATARAVDSLATRLVERRGTLAAP